ncbi:LOW QUALITY PROTEIN: fibrous sheath-interacting protein 1-like [Haliotis rubra]|uniref:LOW QUALITY PROTEIN: fibrous sheath-interacting protein 1-like n=1 Tax=Haliotis rubra TaxID=36100 RepID=UPI001EE5DE9C|nr:LOW QUALITY PROTEIN: fibrous sheath-interacting protein 1-like [Haliotis rubra]
MEIRTNGMDGKNDAVESQVSEIMNGDTAPSQSPDYDSLAERLASLGVSTDGAMSEDGDFDLELQDLSDDSESEYTFDEEDEVNERGRDSSERPPENGTTASGNNIKNDAHGTMQLVPLADDDGEEIDSEEERDLLKEIREEIQNKVKEEMKDELQVYKAKLKAIEGGQLPGDKERQEQEEQEDENLDPKIKEALVKMRKLDRILNKKLKREREVKRDRILLERRIRDEIQNLKPEGREHKEVKVNTEKFVALALPPSHNEGVPVETEPATPVFQTQLNENEFQEMKDKASRKTRSDGEMAGLETQSVAGDSSSRTGEDGKKSKKKKKRKDFIKRNKELAANADEMIAMTEEERERVGALLTDLDSMSDLPEEMDSVIEDPSGDNPFQMLPLRPGEGYCGDEVEVKSMAQIDGQLRGLLPEEEYNSLVCGTPFSSAREPQHKLFTRVDIRSVGEIERYGERALIETKEQREMQARLQRIEEQLARFKNPEELEIETPRLSDDALKGLIDQCVRSLSRSSYADDVSVNESTPRSEVSSVVSVLQNPTRLTDEVLQRLLAEAHFPLSSRLEALQEEDDGVDTEEEERDEGGREAGTWTRQIRAETWKAIAESDIYENGHADDMDLESISRTSSRSTLRLSSVLEKQTSDMSRLYNFAEPEGKRLILPEINQSPYLVSQGLNNQVSKNETHHRRNNDRPLSRDSIDMVRNNLNGDDYVTDRDTEGMIVPRPPSGDRRSNTDLSSSKSRTVTPLLQS